MDWHPIQGRVVILLVLFHAMETGISSAGISSDGPLWFGCGLLNPLPSTPGCSQAEALNC